MLVRCIWAPFRNWSFKSPCSNIAVFFCFFLMLLLFGLHLSRGGCKTELRLHIQRRALTESWMVHTSGCVITQSVCFSRMKAVPVAVHRYILFIIKTNFIKMSHIQVLLATVWWEEVDCVALCVFTENNNNACSTFFCSSAHHCNIMWTTQIGDQEFCLVLSEVTVIKLSPTTPGQSELKWIWIQEQKIIGLQLTTP